MKKLQFSEAQLKYLELCEEEFRERTGIKFRRDDGQGRPILDFSFSKDGLTYGKLMLKPLAYCFGFQMSLIEQTVYSKL